MAAITFSPTPIKNGMGRGFWADAADHIQKCMDNLSETSSLNPATNTVNEFLTAVKAARDME